MENMVNRHKYVKVFSGYEKQQIEVSAYINGTVLLHEFWDDVLLQLSNKQWDHIVAYVESQPEVGVWDWCCGIDDIEVKVTEGRDVLLQVPDTTYLITIPADRWKPIVSFVSIAREVR